MRPHLLVTALLASTALATSACSAFFDEAAPPGRGSGATDTGQDDDDAIMDDTTDTAPLDADRDTDARGDSSDLEDIDDGRDATDARDAADAGDTTEDSTPPDDIEDGADTRPCTEEQCNGEDDDCDGQVDETFPEQGVACDGPDSDQCARGTWRCEAGELRCVEGWQDIIETCNGEDDDCDGLVDEDGTFERLTGVDLEPWGGCADANLCMTAVNRFCQHRSSCFAGGVGPVGGNGMEATRGWEVICIPAPARVVGPLPYATLVGDSSINLASNEARRHANAVANYHCVNHEVGFKHGVGPVTQDRQADTMSVLCLPEGMSSGHFYDAVDISSRGCTSPVAPNGVECSIAVDDWCRNAAPGGPYGGGYGPYGFNGNATDSGQALCFPQGCFSGPCGTGR